MATALSVSDFLKLLFDSGESSQTAVSGNLLTKGLLDLYNWLITFGKVRALLLFSLLVFLLYALKSCCSYLSAVEISTVRIKVVRDIRNDLFAKVLNLPVSYYAKHRKGDLLARFSNDITEYDENILGSLQLLVSAVLSIVLYFSMLVYINVKLTLFVLAMLPLVLLVVSGVSRKLKRQSAEMQQRNAYLLSLIEETIMGLKVIKAYTAIEFSNRRFTLFSKLYTQGRMRMFRRINLASPLSEFLSSCIVIGILIFGSYLVLSHDNGLTPELFVSYIMMFVLMIEPIKNVATAVSQIKKGKACADRLTQVLDEADAVGIGQNMGQKVFTGLSMGIQFRDVCFSYGDSDVLSDICISIPRGRNVALVGSSGSGKSTLVDLLSRFYDVSRGQILIDNIDIRDYSIGSLRSHIGVVAQDTILFNDTIAANIAFGRSDVSADDIQRAAIVANAHDFIMQLPDGYNTNIGDGGDRLSGGQRQRISIARAVLCNPDILIFDEATSALDTESERQVQTALDNLLKGRTAIIIAHRLSTIVNADEIIVLEHGRIVERGTHAQLSKQGGRYSQLVALQQLS
ncbi:MAG: ABC transporter ATP-binding protein [Bacteroidales bacterium]|nr:ABC transporter ATP-binding protein [Candidatus Colimorpha onthohippi]